MANHSNQLLLPNSSFPNAFKSFSEASEKEEFYEHVFTCANSSPEKKLQLVFESNEKTEEFDLKYSVPETLIFVQQHLDAVGKFAISEPSSSFCNIMHQMAPEHGCSIKDDVPERKKLISIMATDESSTDAQGSNLAGLEILGGHGQQREELGTTTLVNSSTFPNISSPSSNNLNHTPIPHHCIEIRDSPVNESPNIASINNETSAVINNIPYSATASNEPTKLALATFAATIELISTLSNFVLTDSSSQAKEHRILLYTVLISSTIAFLLFLNCTPPA